MTPLTLGLLLLFGASAAATIGVLLARGRRLQHEFEVADERLRMALESAHAVAWDWDVRNGRDVFVGDLRTMFGIDADRRDGKVGDFRQQVHAEDRERVFRAVTDARKNRSQYNETFRVVRTDDAIRWVTSRGRFYYSAAGEAIRMLGVANDVTDRHLIEEKLRESEDRFRIVADAVPVMLWMTGPDRMVTYVNRAWSEFTGLPCEAAIGTGWAPLVHPDDLQATLDGYARATEHHRTFTLEQRMRRHDGEYRCVLSSGEPRFMPDGTFAGYAGSAIDITAQREARAVLADLNHRLMSAQESERTLIARELHDDIGQRMALVTMELDSLDRLLPSSVSDTRERLRSVSRQTLGLAKDIQAISHSLHSSQLDHLGLASAAANFCRELTRHHQVDVAFAHHEVPPDLPRDTALCMFRVLQEAATNAVKHAGVARVSVVLDGRAGEIQLEVADGGCGFDPDAAMRNHGLGLISMRERLSLVKGDFSITSRPGIGTTVRARAPLRRTGQEPVAALA